VTEIRFYHLSQSSLEQALPQLLEKVLERGMRAVVMAGSAERVEALTQHLWTYRENSFLPHGNAKDGNAAMHPIWLTEKDENPNSANVLMLTDGAAAQDLTVYEMVCEVFDGAQEENVTAARARWKTYKDNGHTLTYWQQGERGWEKKA
jgi:DNA polymerase-3 subunit chi